MESRRLKVKETLLHLCDLHIPEHDQRSIASVLKYAKDFKPDTVLLDGDILDISSISSHVKGNLRAIEGKTLRKDYDQGERFLDELQKACPNSRIVWMEGNHEFRVQRWLDEHPQAQGLMEIPNALKLSSRKVEWLPSWSQTKVFKKGKANFIHGLYHGKNHAAKMVQAFGCNIFYGHLHDCDSSSLVTLGDNTTKIAQCMGCLCKYKQYYLQGRPTNWQQAFGVFYFREDGYFNHYLPRVFNGKFVSPEGEVYG